VAGGRGVPGTRGPAEPPWGRGSAGRETGDGGTGGSPLAAVSGAAEVPLAAAAPGSAARSAEPLAVPLGAVLVAAAAPEAGAAARSARPASATVPASGLSLAPPAAALSRAAAWLPGRGLEP
jgi:hypothetical protein